MRRRRKKKRRLLIKPWIKKKLKDSRLYTYYNAEKYKKQLLYMMNHADIRSMRPATGDLRRRQIKLLDFYLEVMEELSDLDIHPFAIGGTLVGAIRHRGYIPWDDDIDVGLIQAEFDRITDYFRREGRLYYKKYLGNHNRKNIFLYKKWAYERKGRFFFGVMDYSGELHIIKYDEELSYISLDYVPFAYIKNDIGYEEYRKERMEWGKKADSEKKDAERYIKLFQRQYRTSDCISNEPTENIFLGGIPVQYDGPFKNATHFIKKGTLFPLKKCSFEYSKILIPNNPKAFLENCIKDYMAFPQDVGYSHHIEKWCE